jgi:hypothetical protein
MSPGPRILGLTRDEVRGASTIPSRYFLSRGFRPETRDAFDLGDSRELGRAVVPPYDEEGETGVGFTVRSRKPHCADCRRHDEPGGSCKWGQQKWRIMAGFAKRTYLYNYAAAQRTGDERIFVVEGPPDVWRLAEAGYVGVALLGSLMTDEQRHMLAALDKHVTIALGSDEPGRAAAEKLRRHAVGFTCDFFPMDAPYKDFWGTPASSLRAVIRQC